jgi:hypothetical protein
MAKLHQLGISTGIVSCMRFQLAISNSQAATCNVGQLQVAAGLAPNPSRATQAAPRESDSTEVNQCD